MTVAQSKHEGAAPISSRSDSEAFDVAVIGAGIVGLATAWRFIAANAGRRVLVVEKEDRIAAHQTGHNSGVLHSGIYYKPGSLKAENCRRGLRMMIEFCREHSISHEVCGKVIVATSESEIPALERVHERGVANGVVCRLIDGAELEELEPHASGIRALHVRDAGIVDYVAVCEKLAELIARGGGEIQTGAKLTGLRRDSDRIRLETSRGPRTARAIVNCGGLHSDRIARLSGARPGIRIVPFRGEYYELRESARQLVRNLIYPTPDPRYPFLGVHFTRMIGGGVECGPNAVLALAREGYTWARVSPRDLGGTLSSPGFWRFAARHWRMGVRETWRSLSKRAFVKSLQRLVPEVQGSDLETGPAGVRAQAMTPRGDLLDDFAIVDAERVVNVCNAPSPAATSSLSIGESISQRVAAALGKRL